MSDITLIFNGTEIPAHKVILSAKNEVFKAMFYSVDMVESTAKRFISKTQILKPFI